MTGVEQSLRKFGSQGGVSITQDELLIALSRVDAAVTLEEIKEFFSIVQGSSSTPGKPASQHLHPSDHTVQIAEVLQVLSI